MICIVDGLARARTVVLRRPESARLNPSRVSTIVPTFSLPVRRGEAQACHFDRLRYKATRYTAIYWDTCLWNTTTRFTYKMRVLMLPAK